MSMDITVERRDNLTVYEVSGVIEADRIEAAIREFYREEPTDNVLWEFRNADFSLIWGDDVKRLAQATFSFAEKRPT